MAADLHAIDVLAQVIGVVDDPARQPQDLAFELAQYPKIVRGQRHVSRNVLFNRRSQSGRAGNSMRNRAESPARANMHLPGTFAAPSHLGNRQRAATVLEDET